MIYVVVPEEVGDADEFSLWTSGHAFIQGYSSMEDAGAAARGLAKEHHQSFTVRKLSMVSYHPAPSVRT